jgi:T-complex protein 1 subunit gamma
MIPGNQVPIMVVNKNA